MVRKKSDEKKNTPDKKRLADLYPLLYPNNRSEKKIPAKHKYTKGELKIG